MRKCLACGKAHIGTLTAITVVLKTIQHTCPTSKMNGRKFLFVYFRVFIEVMGYTKPNKTEFSLTVTSVKMMTSTACAHFLLFCYGCGLFNQALYSLFCGSL